MIYNPSGPLYSVQRKRLTIPLLPLYHSAVALLLLKDRMVRIAAHTISCNSCRRGCRYNAALRKKISSIVCKAIILTACSNLHYTYIVHVTKTVVGYFKFVFFLLQPYFISLFYPVGRRYCPHPSPLPPLV